MSTLVKIMSNNVCTFVIVKLKLPLNLAAMLMKFVSQPSIIECVFYNTTPVDNTTFQKRICLGKSQTMQECHNFTYQCSKWKYFST
jgi:hypothetical protein